MAQQNSISILYIEDNVDDQLILRRILKNSVKADIKFDTAKTAEEGRKKLNSNEYDLVFLDYRLPDKTGLEFLEEIRAEGMTVPVIFLTGMGNEKIAVEAMRAGVEDYIIKSEIQTNEFVETIRKRLIKEAPRKPSVDLTPLESEIVESLKSENITELNIVAEHGELYHNGLKKFTRKHKKEVTSVILEQLAEKGVLVETGSRRLIICPICDSGVTEEDKSNYICPNCRSQSIVRMNFLSHPFCGYTGDRRTFVTEDGLVCPNCKVPLMKALEAGGGMDKEGYMIIGNAFECDGCNTRFNRPEMVHECVKCGEEFNYKNMGYIHLKEYRLA